jgi:alpha-D-ribose 1-methylphosphonate 5-triphosphate diphosphatase
VRWLEVSDMARSTAHIARSVRSLSTRKVEPAPFSITNVRAVLPTGEYAASIVVRDGLIARIDSAHASTTRRINGENDYLLPGLIDLHTDNLERHLEPRPGTFWKPERAVLSHDAELASAGITTAFDAITIDGDVGEGARETASFAAVGCIQTMARDGLLRAEHHLHLRCELGNPRLSEQFERAATQLAPSLVSLMDHSPGQGQWVDTERFRAHYARRYGLSESEIEALIARRQAARLTYSDTNRLKTLDLARRHACVVASHDDATLYDVERASGDLCSIAEFPTSIEAARAARRFGMRVVAGAPNLVRGGSHSGNVAVADLAREGLVDILSSDYCPGSLLHAVFLLAESFDMPLHLAVALAGANPAAVLGLSDRGEIREGLRADLVRVRDTACGPVVVSAWCAGRQVA